jgi:hypothetical protein
MPKVYALHAKARKLWHPNGNFRFDDNGESNWPLDQFTKRRIRDGDISLKPPEKREGEEAQQEPQESGRRRRSEHHPHRDETPSS